MLPKWPNDGSSHKIFGALSEDLLGGDGKAEDAKLPGAGIIPKQCPMERVETGTIQGNKFHRCHQGSESQEKC
jgi:hypothetical protein